jgi:hypothetical protein
MVSMKTANTNFIVSGLIWHRLELVSIQTANTNFIVSGLIWHRLELVSIHTANTNFIVSGLIWHRLEFMLYRTRDKHSNYLSLNIFYCHKKTRQMDKTQVENSWSFVCLLWKLIITQRCGFDNKLKPYHPMTKIIYIYIIGLKASIQEHV